MTLGYVGEGGFPKVPHAICDMHTWIEIQPNGVMFAVSPKFKDVLERFNIPFKKFYNGSINWKNKEYSYFVFHVLIYKYDYIDFNKSSFYKSNVFGAKKSDESVQGENMNKIQEKIGAMRWIFDKAVMKPEFKEIDLLYLDLYKILISERLKNAIEEANLTGVKITPCPIEFHLSNEV